MIELIILVVVAAMGLIWWFGARRTETVTPAPADRSILPERFVVFDLETTGLHPDKHEIIEIGAIRVNRDSDNHKTFQALVTPKKRITKRITAITGITNEMVNQDGMELEVALAEFRSFVGDLPLVAFNAEFDDAFLRASCACVAASPFTNEICCALKLARRAWPGRTSYRLSALAGDGNLSLDEEHRALGDCRRTMIVYAAAASATGSYR
jgi:DNA polymerase III subunit epsilon